MARFDLPLDELREYRPAVAVPADFGDFCAVRSRRLAPTTWPPRSPLSTTSSRSSTPTTSRSPASTSRGSRSGCTSSGRPTSTRSVPRRASPARRATARQRGLTRVRPARSDPPPTWPYRQFAPGAGRQLVACGDEHSSIRLQPQDPCRGRCARRTRLDVPPVEDSGTPGAGPCAGPAARDIGRWASWLPGWGRLRGCWAELPEPGTLTSRAIRAPQKRLCPSISSSSTSPTTSRTNSPATSRRDPGRL